MAEKTQATKLNGRNIVIFIGGKAVALTTDTTLSLKAETFDSSTKDDGVDGSMDINKCTWSATNDSYYSADPLRSADVTGEALQEKFWAAEPVEVVIGNPTNMTDAEMATEGWTVPSTSGWKGKALITAFDLKATNGQKATCSFTLEGIGKLTKIEAA